MTDTSTLKIPHTLALIGGGISHAVMVGGAIALYLTGKIDTPAFVAIMAAFGGAWSGVATTLITAKGSQAVTPSPVSSDAPGVVATPVTHTSATPVEAP